VRAGELKGFKATEKPIGFQGATVLWFTPEGLIKEEHDYANFATVLSQTGISKAKGRPVATAPASPEVVTAKESPEEKANVEVAEKVNKAWEAKKADDVTALFSDDAVWDDLTLTPAKGKKEIKKYVSTFFTGVPDGKAASANTWPAGDWVIEEATYGGTHKGALFGTPASNKAFTIHELTIYKLGADRKITQATTYGNDLELAAQIDPKSLPKPPAPKSAPAKPDAAKADPTKPAAPKPDAAKK